jgi:ribosomal protein S18 acetylase RimI-like enzyme
MNSEPKIRLASDEDLDFVTQVDLEDEGITNAIPGQGSFDQHRCRMQEFLRGDGAAWIIEISGVSRPAGVIMCRFRHLEAEEPIEENLFLLKYLPRDTFPTVGRFTEIYQLWVDPAFRRRGFASTLKQHLESESMKRGITQIYTHTEQLHVVQMNLNLGYRVVREGPMWDEIIRVSLVKDFETMPREHR